MSTLSNSKTLRAISQHSSNGPVLFVLGDSPSETGERPYMVVKLNPPKSGVSGKSAASSSSSGSSGDPTGGRGSAYTVRNDSKMIIHPNGTVDISYMSGSGSNLWHEERRGEKYSSPPEHLTDDLGSDCLLRVSGLSTGKPSIMFAEDMIKREPFIPRVGRVPDGQSLFSATTLVLAEEGPQRPSDC